MSKRSKQRSRGLQEEAAVATTETISHRLHFGIIVVAVFVVFSPALFAGFVDWDDPLNVTQNPFLKAPILQNLLHLWTHEYSNLYVPLVYTSYIFDQVIGGGNAWAFHLTNIVLHAVTGSIVYWILLELLQRTAPASSSVKFSFSALLGALLFALHPMQVESVAWVTGRKDTLAGAWAFAAIALFVRAIRTDCLSRRHYIAALAAFLLSLLAKPAGASLPLALAAIAWFVYRVPLKRTVLICAPYFILGAAWAFATSRVQSIPVNLESIYPALWQRPFIAADTTAFYLMKVLLPLQLSPVYEKQLSAVASSSLAFVILPALITGYSLVLRRSRELACAATIFLAMLLPVLGFVPFLYQVYATAADRYVYVALFGPVLAVTLFLIRAPNSVPFTWTVRAVVVIYAVLSFNQATVWRGSETLWRHAFRVSPNVAVTNTSMGIIERTRGNHWAAIEHYKRAIRLDPRSPEAHHNLGILYVRQNQLKEAEAHFETATELLPGNPAPLEALNDVRNRLGK